MSNLLDKLKEQGLLDASGVERAAALVGQGQPVDDAVIAGGGVPEAALIGLLAAEFNLPVADLSKEIPEKAFLNTFPVRLLLRHNVLPLSEKNGVVRIASGRALSNPGVAKLRLATGKRFEIALAPREEIDRKLKELLGVGADTMQSLVSDSDADGIQVLSDEESDGDLERQAEDASIIRFVNQVLTEAIELRATDVHFEPFEARFRVRYRVDGELVEASIPSEVRRFQAAIVSRIKILSHLDIAEKRTPQDGRIKLKIAAREVDVRVSIIPMLHGEAVVLRLLDRSSPLLGMERLGMAKHDRDHMERVLDLPHGIVLVTGPTGSGKTTTLYAGLAKINDISRKIVTIEDPIEYQLDGISQIQVQVKSGMTFAAGLRAILRHDPDVVLIGEIRDYETAEIAVQASLTGHLVFSTLHTNDAPGAVTRLVEMGVEPYLVASSLELVLAQRLVRLLCKECKQEVEPTDLECRELKAEFGNLAPKKVWKGMGCRACRGAGFRGRQGVFEVMPVSDEIRGMVLNNAAANQIRKVAVKEGMKSLREDGKRLMLEGKTTLDEVMRMTKEELTAGGMKQ